MISLPATEFVERIKASRAAALCGVYPIILEEGKLVAAPSHPFDAMPSLSWLDDIADDSGWYRSHIQKKDGPSPLSMFEPKLPTPISTPAALFHATRIEKAKGIIDQGVRLADLSTTWTDRTYFTPRAFFTTSLVDAGEIIRSLIARGPADRSDVELTPDLLDQHEVFAISPGERPYYLDVLAPPSVWTDHPVSKHEVRQIEGWREQLLRAPSFKG